MLGGLAWDHIPCSWAEMCLHITQIWNSTCSAHTWAPTRLPDFSSPFTPPWLQQASSASWRVPKALRAQSRAGPWVLQPRTFLAFLCQPVTMWLLFPSCRFGLGYSPSWGGLNFTTRPEIPLHKNRSWVFWEVALMLHVWHHKKGLHVPFWYPIYLVKQTKRASTTMKLPTVKNVKDFMSMSSLHRCCAFCSNCIQLPGFILNHGNSSRIIFPSSITDSLFLFCSGHIIHLYMHTHTHTPNKQTNKKTLFIWIADIFISMFYLIFLYTSVLHVCN